MKRWIRWQGVIAFLAVGVIFSVLWFFFIDGFVERMIEKYGTRALGAKVELDDADLSLFPAGLRLTRLQVTNPDEPMRNAVEIDRINMSLDTLNLLRRKVIINEMALENIRLNTPRKTSGAVVSRVETTPSVSKKPSIKGLCGKIEVPTFEIPDVKKIMENEDLESLRLVQSLQKEIGSEKDNWEKRLKELPGKEKFDEYRQRIERLKSGKEGGPAALLKGAGDLATIQKDLQHDLGLIKGAREDFGGQMSSLKARFDEATKAPLKDVERLKRKYSISPEGLSNMSRMLFGVKLCGWAQKAISWYEKLKPFLERVKKEKKGSEVVRPARGGGLNVRFKEYAPLPDFLVRRVKAVLLVQAGNLSGKIENITPDQDVLGIPLTFDFSGQGINVLKSIKIDGSLDHIVPARSKDTVNVLIHDFTVSNLPLLDKAELPFTLKNATGDMKLNALLSGDKISADFLVGLNSVKLLVGTREGVSPIVQAIGSALSDISEFTVRAALTGTIEDYNLQITSDLDGALKSAAGKIVQRELGQFEEQLKTNIFAKVDGPLGQTKGSLNGLNVFGNELTGRLNMGTGLLTDAKSPLSPKMPLPFFQRQ